MSATNLNQTQREGNGPASTDEPIVHGEIPAMATVPVLAARPEISPATAYRWVGEKKFLAWECWGMIKGPMDQVRGPQEPLPALAEIAAVLDLPPELM